MSPTTNKAISDYGPLLYSIYHCDDHRELQTLANEYLKLYGQLEEKSRGQDDIARALSDFFCNCDEYYPDDDEAWGTIDVKTAVNSIQLREAAGRTLGQLENAYSDVSSSRPFPLLFVVKN